VGGAREDGGGDEEEETVQDEFGDLVAQVGAVVGAPDEAEELVF